MGRKIEMKKIENTTKCQVTYSKRRSSLIKKANELSFCCDVEVAVLSFSPSGRVTRFATPTKIEEVLTRYANLPPERRLTDMCNVQSKLEKLNKLSHINGDYSKLHHLENQVENLELQIKKRCLELQIQETDLRDYEVAPEQDASLHQLLWCERNLSLSLQKVVARKMELVQLEGHSRNSLPNNLKQKEKVSFLPENPIAGEILMQLDPWISPYSAKVRDSIFQDLVDQAVLHPNYPVNDNIWAASSSSAAANVPNFNAPIQQYPPPPGLNIPSEQPLMMDQPMFNLHEQNNIDAILKQSLMMDDPFNFQAVGNVGAYSASSALFSDAVHISAQNFSNFQDPIPRSSAATNPHTTTGSLLQSLYDEMGVGSSDSNLMNQFNMGDNNSTMFSYGNINPSNAEINNVAVEGRLCTDNNVPAQELYQPHDPYNVLDHHQESAQYVDPLLNGSGDCVWSSNQENGSSWDWEDLLRVGDCDFTNFPPA